MDNRGVERVAMLERAKEAANDFATDARAQRRTDLPGVMIVLVVAGVIGFIGLQVMSTVIDQTALNSGDPLYNASESLQSSINDAWGLLGVAFIVVILAVIVVYLYGLRGR